MINFIQLEFTPGNKWLLLDEINGATEQRVNGTKSVDAILLLDGCINKMVESEYSFDNASELTIADRERALVAIYQNTYGPKVNSVVKCNTCNQPFDLDFKLDEVVNSFRPQGEIKKEDVNGRYVYTTDTNLSFRLCTGADELAVMGMDALQAEVEIMRRCLLEGEMDSVKSELPDLMEKVAPLFDTEFDANCPECSSKQKFHFNLQQYLLTSLIQEKKQLTLEAHSLATAYNWGLAEILELPRTQRRMFMNLLDSG